MAVEQFFNNQPVIEPGVYSQTKSGIVSKPEAASYGKVLIIDTGSGANYGGGAGFKGRNASGGASVYSFNTLQDFRDHVQGGDWYTLAENLFFPMGRQNRNIKGVPSIDIVRAATTAPAHFTYNGGMYMQVTARAEGGVGNGTLLNGVLTAGYGCKMVVSQELPGAFELAFYGTSYKGLNLTGRNVENPISSATNVLLAKSPPLVLASDLINWMATDRTFNQYFSGTASPNSAGAFNQTDLGVLVNMQPFIGGTEYFDDGMISDILDTLSESDYTFVLSDQGTFNVSSATNVLILGHLVLEAKYKKYLVLAGGQTPADLPQSISAAAIFNSSRAILVHGGELSKNRLTGLMEPLPTMTKACKVLGRLAGLAPYNPLTYKAIAVEAEMHTLSQRERTRAIKAGVLHTKFDDGDHVINLGINTLQNNKVMVTDQGESPYIQVELIDAQLRKDLSLQTKRRFLKKINDGPNRFTMSEVELENFTKQYLGSVTVKDGENNLILSFQDVVATITADAIHVTFGYVPNFEVNKVFFTSIMLDPNAGA